MCVRVCVRESVCVLCEKGGWRMGVRTLRACVWGGDKGSRSGKSMRFDSHSAESSTTIYRI